MISQFGTATVAANAPAADTTDLSSVVRAKAPMPRVRRQARRLRVTEMKQRLVITGCASMLSSTMMFSP
jgi:hypothetical protein